jgi:hypothetical protein
MFPKFTVTAGFAQILSVENERAVGRNLSGIAHSHQKPRLKGRLKHKLLMII